MEILPGREIVPLTKHKAITIGMLFKRLQQLLFKAGILLSVPALLLSAHSPQQLSAREIIQNMTSAVERINTLKFKLKKIERVEDELKKGEQDVKFNRTPKKIYTLVREPNKGVEVLWVEGQNNRKAIVNPNGFPYITLSLDPYSSSMRNNNHHTVHEVGFDFINTIVKRLTEKSGKDFDKYFRYTGDTTFDNKDCYMVLIDYTPFQFVNYTVKAGESVTDIAYKFLISDFMILEINEEIDDYEDVEAGQVIKIPNVYAKKTILCIDKKTYLPIVQKMYDKKGLFGQYEFHNLQLNPIILKEEFTKEYKDYNF